MDLLLLCLILAWTYYYHWWFFFDFFTYNFGKVSLIFRISLVIKDKDKACTYNFLVSFFTVGWLFLLKNLDISLTSLGVFVRISKDNLTKLAGLSVCLLFLDLVLISWTFRVNLNKTFYLKVWLSLSKTNESYSDL